MQPGASVYGSIRQKPDAPEKGKASRKAALPGRVFCVSGIT